jgi:outer membrane receptor protein involved in Fe transport
MKSYVYLIAVFIVLIPETGLAQSAFKGTVSNEEGNPVENVLIKNLTSSTHAHSDKEGNFVLENAIVNDTLKIIYPEYDVLYFRVENDTPANITLFRKTLKLEEVSISSGLKQLNTVSKIDLGIQPVTSSQELLRKVPGLFIGQHAGGGKAEQIFLRGFDIDHGTDINISVDGMPVNMVSHAHGQGYADLHFLIPETVEEIDFDKGPYFAEKGDLTTAGYVEFKTKDKIDNSLISAETGQYNTFRALGMFNLLNTKRQSAYFTAEYLMTNNYFDAPQNFSRINLFGKYTATFSARDKVSISASHFKSLWDASGQIPDRAVNAGLISFYGAIDPTEGGNTSRSNFNLQHNRQTAENAYIKNTVYLSHYDFELYSNFTFFLEDPVNGDQIRQKENRLLLACSPNITKK